MPARNGMRPVHPGELLQEDYMTPLHMSATRLAHFLRVPANRISEIIKGRRGVSAETALRLARFFSTTPQFWLHLQQDYELRLAEHTVGAQINREVHPLELSI